VIPKTVGITKETAPTQIIETLAENSIVECSEIGKTNIPSGVGRRQIRTHIPPFDRRTKQYPTLPTDFYCTVGANKEFYTLSVVCCY